MSCRPILLRALNHCSKSSRKCKWRHKQPPKNIGRYRFVVVFLTQLRSVPSFFQYQVYFIQESNNILFPTLRNNDFRIHRIVCWFQIIVFVRWIKYKDQLFFRFLLRCNETACETCCCWKTTLHFNMAKQNIIS